MNRHPLKQKYWSVGNERVKQIQDYFLRFGESDKDIADKFGVEKSIVSRITKDALRQYKNERKSKAYTG